MNTENYIKDELIDNLIRTTNELSEILPTCRELDTEELNHFFRTIHSLKGNAFYMDNEHIGNWAGCIESVLSKLRDGLTSSDEILNWLNSTLKQIDEWVYQLQESKTLSYIDIYNKEPDFLNEDNSIVYDMQILYIGNKENIKKILKYKFPKCYSTTDQHKIDNLVKSESVEIIIFDDEVDIKTIDKTVTLLNNRKICYLGITTNNLDSIPPFIDKEFLFNPKKEKLSELHNKIFNSVKLNKDLANKIKRRLKLKMKYIEHLICNITAMPESIRKIQRIVDSPEFKMPDLITAIKSDPIAVGIIYKESTNPVYKFDVIQKDIDRLIILFGPKLILSILIKKMMKASFKHNLAPYSLSVTKFLHLANKRSVIVNKWINKNGYFDITDAVIASFLASLGQYILSEDIMFIGKEGLFKNLIEDDIEIKEAEKQIAGYSMTHLSSILLENWEFKKDVCYALLRTDNYNIDLKNTKIKKIAAIVSFMFSAIDQTGKRNMQYNYSDDFKDLGLNLESLEKIIKDFT